MLTRLLCLLGVQKYEGIHKRTTKTGIFKILPLVHILPKNPQIFCPRAGSTGNILTRWTDFSNPRKKYF